MEGLSRVGNGSGSEALQPPDPFSSRHLNPLTPSPQGEGETRFTGFLYFYSMVYISKSREYLLHLDAVEGTFEKAHALRQNMTEAEKILWNELKNRKFMGLKFRRQHPIHRYIGDFYCHEKKLIIEVDGGIHDQEEINEHDLNRTAELDRLGISVIRFKNEQVFNQLDQVLHEIGKQIESMAARNPPSP
jgi:very-short-patch-repair endonuclease